jgi:hypothetical protein
MTDPILDELHQTRRRLLAKAGGTLEGLAASLQARQHESGRQILETRRTIRCTGAAKPTDLPVEHQSSPPRDR